MDKEKQLFTVCCVNCGVYQFKFSQNLLEEYEFIELQCPECRKVTHIEYNGLSGVVIK